MYIDSRSCERVNSGLPRVSWAEKRLLKQIGGSINTYIIYRGMNIHSPANLVFTRGGFDPYPGVFQWLEVFRYFWDFIDVPIVTD